jgi:DNA-binding transcriptional regulator GbsR (MarR family)
MSILGLPRSALIVLGSLAKDGPMCPKDICKTVGLAPRTVSFALRKLMHRQLLQKIPNLSDMRKSLYITNEEKMKELFMKFGIDSIKALQPAISSLGQSSRSLTR